MTARVFELDLVAGIGPASVAAALAARLHHERVPFLGRAAVRVIYDPPGDGLVRDGAEIAESVAGPVAGGMAAAGVGAVCGVTGEIGPRPYPRGRIRVVITEAEQEEGDAS